MRFSPLACARTRVVFVGSVLIVFVVIASIAAPLIISRASATRARVQEASQPQPDQTEIAANYGKLPLSFEKNEGQVGSQVEFISRGPGYDVFLMSSGAVLSLRKSKPFAADSKSLSYRQTQPELSSLLYLKMLGANPRAAVKGEDELPGKVNYFVGNDPSGWHTNIPTYRRVEYTGIFPGVDLVYYGNRTQLEYDFILAPGAKVNSIKFRIDGAERIAVGKEGELRLATKHGDVQMRKPEIYQLSETGDRQLIEGAYEVKGRQIGFKVASFDSRKPLVIDPVLSYSTLLGTGGNETGNGIAVDSQGNAYVTGVTSGNNFPTTPGAIQTIGSGLGGAFVTKLDPTGTSLIYSTYLTGNGGSVGHAIAVDSAGNAFVTGYTGSADFPTLNPIRGGRNNLLITNDGGSNWTPSNVGTLNRAVQTLAIDRNASNTIYAGTGNGGGIFKSTDGGINWTAVDTGVAGASVPVILIDPSASNVIYAALNSSGSNAGVYKSTNGGVSWSFASTGVGLSPIASMAIDPQNPSTLYVSTTSGFFKTTNGGTSWSSSGTGMTFSGLPAIVIDPSTSTTAYAASNGGVYKTTNNGANWGFVNTGLTTVQTRALVMDPTSVSTLYVGTSGGGVFKTTNGGGGWSPINTGLPANLVISSLAIDPSSTSTIFLGTSDGRIFKSSNGGASWTVLYQTTTNTNVRTLVVDPNASLKVLAGADSSGQTIGNTDAFVTKINPAGSGLVYSTFLGGTRDDQANGIAIDTSGNAYVVGQTLSSEFHSVNAFQPTFGGPSSGPLSCGDGFVAKLTPSGSSLSFSTFLGGTGCDVARSVALDNSGGVYVTGQTTSANLATPGAFMQADPSNEAAYAAKLSTAGALGYFTYLGGNGTDIGYGIATDSSGNAYLTGLTTSTNFPTLNPIQATNGGAAGDAFVTKLNSSGSALIYSTYLGGSTIDAGRGIAVDSQGSAYISGYSSSAEFPLVAGALRTKSPFYKTMDGGGTWNNDNYGLKAGAISALAVDPVTPSTIFAGSSGILHKSTDSGRNWAPIMNGLVDPVVTAVVVNPTTPSTIYLASDTSGFGTNRGVFKSNNGGNSWSPVNNGLVSGISWIAIDPLTPDTLYALSGTVLYKTTNGGGVWNPIGPSSFLSRMLVVDPSTPTKLYAAETGGKVLKSIDGGATWLEKSNGLTGSVGSLAIDRTTPSTLYSAGFNGGLFKTVDGAENWTSINPGLTGGIAVDPQNSSIVYASSPNTGLFKSTNGGAAWTSINKSPFLVFSVVINPGLTSTIYGAGNSLASEEDAFVSRLSVSGTSLIYSTFLGGVRAPGDSLNLNDEAHAIALDAGGNVYVTGFSRSPDFPVDPNSYQPFNRGFEDAFVSKLGMSFSLSGQVLDGTNAPVSGVEVVLSDGSSLSSVLTGTDGFYQFPRLREGGNFTVSAAKPHFTMTPATQTFNNLSSNQTQNFVATPTNSPFYTLSGQITNNSSGLSGVTVTLSGSQQSLTSTDSNGNYSFTLAGGGNYTLTPSILGFSFGPASQTFNNLSADQTANFLATRQNFVVTNANDHGTGSLRQAVFDANATQGLDTITFNIPGPGVQTINLVFALPVITDPVIIDATTQPGYAGSPLVELNGLQAGNANGLEVTAGNSTIRGLAIGGFSNGSGIRLSTNGGNTVQANYVGLDATGTVLRRNNVGVQAILGSNNNLIGGITTAARNVISGSTFSGVSAAAANNQIQGNFIGTNASGLAAIPNATGVDITGSPQFINNLVGGTVPGAGNVISGNSNTGVNLGPGNTVQGNLIGTDATGFSAVPNGTGISATNGNTLIGGVVPGARNVISGNTGDGVSMGGAGSLLQGNFIGTDITGSAALGNSGGGVSTTGVGAVIGGTVAAARNIISGNAGFGNVSLGSNSSGATVQGNYIGTDLTGSVALTNSRPGISIQSSSHVVGGATPEARNIISGNTTGIQIGGNTTANVGGNLVQGNYIGLNQAGNPLANSLDGIRLENSSNNPPANNVIGGVVPGAGNRISFNGGNGVLVSSGTGNSIRGNSIVSNGSLGIDLAPAGITANDQGDADTGANNRQNFPTVTTVTPAANPTTINGALNSTANTAFRIDFYSNASCDPSGSGEGAQLLDTTTITTAADGNAAINYSLLSPVQPGTIITATATDPNGNTSEFSRCTTAGIVIGMGQATYTVGESGGLLNVTVNRSGDTAAAVNVDYTTGADNGMPCSTANGVATPKCDFTTALGTVNFAAGQTNQTIAILISQDSFVEGSETFSMSLSNPTGGAALGTPATSTITITDDASEPPTNLIDDPRNFVRQHYHDFLSREPDQSGWDFWTNQITSCGTDVQCNEVRRVDVSASFFLSIEFQQTGYLVERFYKVGYGDATGTSTFGGQHQLAVPILRFSEFLKDTQRIGQGVVVLAPGWEQLLESNKQAYAIEFVQSTRFIQAFPTTMTPTEFVDKLNQNAGNVLSPSESANAINLFGGSADSSNTTNRAQAVRMVAEDTDLFSAEYNRAFVLAEYFGYLRRNPNDAPETSLDYTGYDFWLTKLNQFNGNYINAEMVKAFLSSIEYRQRFGP